MSDRPANSDDMFAERVARVLRAPEAFGDDFESELAAAIRSDHASQPRRAASPGRASWWTSPITIRLSPVVGLAMAASIALIAVLAARTRSAPAPLPQVAQVVHDTVNVVRFVFVGEARSVALVGDFNAWRPDATPLQATGTNATWAVSVPLDAGRHEYAFIVDGERWVADPFATSTSDDFDTQSSIITVGTTD